MKIKQIRAVTINLPLPNPQSRPWRPAWSKSTSIALPISKYRESYYGLPSNMPGMGRSVWVQVIAEDGTWGLGRCSFGRPVAAIVDDIFTPLLEGRDCFATEYLNDLMWRATQHHGVAGLTAVAQSGVDLALWDLKGKLLDMPVYRLLGSPCREIIRLYATSDDLDWSHALGFTAFKITNQVHYDMGISGLNQMEAKVAQAREVVGYETELMINPVMAYSTTFTIQTA